MHSVVTSREFTTAEAVGTFSAFPVLPSTNTSPVYTLSPRSSAKGKT